MLKKLMCTTLALTLSLSTVSITHAKDAYTDAFENTFALFQEESAFFYDLDYPDFLETLNYETSYSIPIQGSDIDDYNIDFDFDYTDDGESLAGNITLKGEMAVLLNEQLPLALANENSTPEEATLNFYIDDEKIALSSNYLPSGVVIQLEDYPELETLNYSTLAMSLETIRNMDEISINQELFEKLMFRYFMDFNSYLLKGDVVKKDGDYTLTMDSALLKEYLVDLSDKISKDTDIPKLFLTFDNIITLYKSQDLIPEDFTIQSVIDEVSESILLASENIPEDLLITQIVNINNGIIYDLDMTISNQYAGISFGYNSKGAATQNLNSDITYFINILPDVDYPEEVYKATLNSKTTTKDETYENETALNLYFGDLSVFEFNCDTNGTAYDQVGFMEMIVNVPNEYIGNATVEITTPISEKEFNEKLAIAEEYQSLRELYDIVSYYETYDDYVEDYTLYELEIYILEEDFNNANPEEILTRIESASEEGLLFFDYLVLYNSYDEYVESIEISNQRAEEAKKLIEASGVNGIDLTKTPFYFKTNFTSTMNDEAVIVNFTDFDILANFGGIYAINNGKVSMSIKDLGNVKNTINVKDYISPEELEDMLGTLSTPESIVN